MKISTVPLINAPQDMASSILLPAIYVGNIVNYSIQLVFSGSPVGDLKLQFSNDPAPQPAPTFATQRQDIVNWTDVDESVQHITEAGDHMWNVQNAGTVWVRAVYVPQSGSGSMTVANITVKGV